jgi:FdhE protein
MALAECCDDDGRYLMLEPMDKDAHAKSAADDLPGAMLDLLVSEAGIQRHGVSPMHLFDDPDAITLPPP